VNKQEKATHIAEILENLYPETPVPLQHSDPYTLLIAVLLSAQCTDERVNKITPSLFAEASDPFAMAELAVDHIREIIRPCGLSPRKSKAISINTMVKFRPHSNYLRNYLESVTKLHLL